MYSKSTVRSWDRVSCSQALATAYSVYADVDLDSPGRGTSLLYMSFHTPHPRADPRRDSQGIPKDPAVTRQSHPGGWL